jgi:ABC-type multidrug transport system fused ATPase/permease subunit
MPLLDLFWAMLWFFLWIVWIWLVITLFADVFRSEDLSGWAKAAWVFFLVFLPYLGALVYLIARGKSMQERAQRQMDKREQMTRTYIQDVAGQPSAADELTRLAQLRDSGALTDAEFQAQKERILTA